MLDDRVTLLEETRLPVAGRGAVAAALHNGLAAVEWRPQHAAVTHRDGPAGDEISDIRIWQRTVDGMWTVMVQKTNPVAD